jgi:hypothetical protein
VRKYSEKDVDMAKGCRYQLMKASHSQSSTLSNLIIAVLDYNPENKRNIHAERINI